MNYLVRATQVIYFEALVEGESFDDAAERFLNHEYIGLAQTSEDEPIIEEVVQAP